MSDLKRRPSNKQRPDYPAADEVLRNRREFLAIAAKVIAVAAVPVFAASCMGAADPRPAEPQAKPQDEPQKGTSKTKSQEAPKKPTPTTPATTSTPTGNAPPEASSGGPE